MLLELFQPQRRFKSLFWFLLSFIGTARRKEGKRQGPVFRKFNKRFLIGRVFWNAMVQFWIPALIGTITGVVIGLLFAFLTMRAAAFTEQDETPARIVLSQTVTAAARPSLLWIALGWFAFAGASVGAFYSIWQAVLKLPRNNFGLCRGFESAADGEDEDKSQLTGWLHPLSGLVRFGPFSRSLINAVLDPIRIATICPNGFRNRVRNLLRDFEQRHYPRERKNYLIEFPGFSRIFGLRITPASDEAHIELTTASDHEITNAERPHLRLADIFTRSINRLDGLWNEFDVILIFLPDRWKRAFYGDNGDFDLHDYIKAVNASKAIPTQIVRESSALNYFCRASVMWRLGIALYCKAGGVPWKLADMDPDTAYVGLSYAMRFNEHGRVAFVICCSQVFDSDGAGLEFVAYETDDVRIVKYDPYLSRTEMRRLMARTLTLYQRRHAGRSPRRVIIHKTTEFKPEEIDGCFDAWSSSEGIELYQIQQETLWRGIHIEPPRNHDMKTGSASAYPCFRGGYFQLGSREALVWTQGNVPEVVGGKNFYKEGKSIPHPIILRRFAGHGGWHEPVRAVLGLSKMNWNNDSLYDRLPVTLSYASTLARTVKRMPMIHSRPYEFRLFM